MTTTILWFRNDLRLDDNSALAAAIEAGGDVIPVFIWSPEEDAGWPPGGASKWWLHQALLSLEFALSEAWLAVDSSPRQQLEDAAPAG